MTKQVEVLIIGSGFGGAVAAQRLAAAGREVVMLERGPWRDTVPNRSLGLKNLVPLPQEVKRSRTGYVMWVRIGSKKPSHSIKKALSKRMQARGSTLSVRRAWGRKPCLCRFSGQAAGRELLG